ncbi:MAG: YciI family protein [Gammaproteobacteria bacterium]|nr:YciI family protein [Gammaproteobacteria bacterium]MDH3410966.1 YciI family protein [Gammaproteobacteria bacterium]
MLWAISRVAASNFAELREKGLQPHLDYLKSQKKILVLSGATTSDDGKEFVGSLLIVNVGTRAEAQAFADGDPFMKASMFRDVKITRMRKGQLNPEAAEGA